MTRTISVVWLLVTVGFVTCRSPHRTGGEHPIARSEAHGAQDSVGLLLDWRLEPEATERPVIMRALVLIAELPNAPDLRRRAFPAQVYRLGASRETRYVLLAHQQRFTGADGEHWGKSFYVLEISGQTPVLSSPLDMKDAEYVVLESLRDVNGDGAPDLVYCKGYEGEEEPPRRLAAEYREQRWVHLPEGLVSPAFCDNPS